MNRTKTIAILGAVVLLMIAAVTAYQLLSSNPQQVPETNAPTTANSNSTSSITTTTSSQPAGLSHTCPADAGIANISYSNMKGVLTLMHPTPSYTELVIRPNSTAKMTVTFSSQEYDLSFYLDSSKMGINPADPNRNKTAFGLVPIWTAHNPTESTTNLNITLNSVIEVNNRLILVNYTLTAGPQKGIYILALPSTCLDTFVNVGEQPYTGPLPWDNVPVP